MSNMQENCVDKQKTWEIVQAARSVGRPRASAFVHSFKDFDELKGDRVFGDCQAIVGGTAMFLDKAILVLGQEKGHDLQSRMKHNFGMPMPEGYRKSARLYQLAERYRLPVVIFLDSPGAYAGVEAEKRNQSQAIAQSMLEMAGLTVPIIVFIIGEAMSGGAMAMGVSDHTAMLSNSIYAVISPEGCSGILWKDKAHVQHAAHAMGVTARCAQAHGFVDEVLEEPDFSLPGSTDVIIKQVHAHLDKVLSTLWTLSPESLISRREKRFLCIS